LFPIAGRIGVEGKLFYRISITVCIVSSIRGQLGFGALKLVDAKPCFTRSPGTIIAVI
jgi:hypothetical protein